MNSTDESNSTNVDTSFTGIKLLKSLKVSIKHHFYKHVSQWNELHNDRIYKHNRCTNSSLSSLSFTSGEVLHKPNHIFVLNLIFTILYRRYWYENTTNLSHITQVTRGAYSAISFLFLERVSNYLYRIVLLLYCDPFPVRLCLFYPCLWIVCYWPSLESMTDSKIPSECYYSILHRLIWWRQL